jgi:5-methylcytosine-specific restriction endonuclease McrA
VKREVWTRDGGKCQWRLPDGRVCGSTHRLEIDHVRPRALGGESTIENCRIVCRAHNGLAARRVFGDEWMDRCARRKRSG